MTGDFTEGGVWPTAAGSPGKLHQQRTCVLGLLMRRFGFLFLIVLLCAWSWGAPAPVAFVTNGSNGASEGIPTSPNAFYDSTNNTTWVFWDGTPDNTNRYAYAATYNHTTLTRSSDYEIIQNNLTSTDIHGTPGAVMDQYGYVHVFCCSHNSDASYAISTNPHSSLPRGQPVRH